MVRLGSKSEKTIQTSLEDILLPACDSIKFRFYLEKIDHLNDLGILDKSVSRHNVFFNIKINNNLKSALTIKEIK